MMPLSSIVSVAKGKTATVLWQIHCAEFTHRDHL